MKLSIKGFLPVLLLFIVWSCGTPNHVKKNWAEHREEYKQLTEYSEFLNKLGIAVLTQIEITTTARKTIAYADIKSEYPEFAEQIFAIMEKVKKIDVGMGIGKGYCSFFIKSGGSIGSDEFLLFTETEDGFENFKRDSSKYGYGVFRKSDLEKNWYYIYMD